MQHLLRRKTNPLAWLSWAVPCLSCLLWVCRDVLATAGLPEVLNNVLLESCVFSFTGFSGSMVTAQAKWFEKLLDCDLCVSGSGDSFSFLFGIHT